MPWSRKNIFKQKMKAIPIKAKMNKLNYIKIKNLTFFKRYSQEGWRESYGAIQSIRYTYT